MEIERLKTELMLQSKQLNDLKNIEEECERLKGQHRAGESESFQLKEQLGNLKNTVAERDERVSEANAEIAQLRAQVEQLKQENQQA